MSIVILASERPWRGDEEGASYKGCHEFMGSGDREELCAEIRGMVVRIMLNDFPIRCWRSRSPLVAESLKWLQVRVTP